MPLATRWNQRGKVIIMSETTDEPLTLAGACAGTCWGADTKDHEKNFKRGLECLRNGHGRTLEFAQIYMILDGWSAKVIREWYTHIIDVSRLQASTRYIDYSNFDYITPKIIEKNSEAKEIYENTIKTIQKSINDLNNMGIPKEDSSGLLPLNYSTKIVFRCSLRELINIMEQRLCSRAYHEMRELCSQIIEALKIYSDEWEYIIENEHIFEPKCYKLKYCPEKNSCGRFRKE